MVKRLRRRPLTAKTGVRIPMEVLNSEVCVLRNFLFYDIYDLECVSKIPEYAISGVAAPFLRHKARLSAAKPSDLFLELTKNPLGSADCPA